MEAITHIGSRTACNAAPYGGRKHMREAGPQFIACSLFPQYVGPES